MPPDDVHPKIMEALLGRGCFEDAADVDAALNFRETCRSARDSTARFVDLYVDRAHVLFRSVCRTQVCPRLRRRFYLRKARRHSRSTRTERGVTAFPGLSLG